MSQPFSGWWMWESLHVGQKRNHSPLVFGVQIQSAKGRSSIVLWPTMSYFWIFQSQWFPHYQKSWFPQPPARCLKVKLEFPAIYYHHVSYSDCGWIHFNFLCTVRRKYPAKKHAKFVRNMCLYLKVYSTVGSSNANHALVSKQKLTTKISCRDLGLS